MTITTYTDREIALRQQLATMTATATEYQQAADKMAMEHKVERDRVVEPVATLWQHGETGRTRVIMPDTVTDCDARWHMVGPLYLHPPAQPEQARCPHDYVPAPASLGGNICKLCGRMEGKPQIKQGAEPVKVDPLSELGDKASSGVEGSILAEQRAKRWPFTETPGEFTERLQLAIQHFNGYLLGAVRNVLIENPPELAHPPAQPELDLIQERDQLQARVAELEALIEASRQQEPVYAFRRKGLDDFCTCSEKRFLELYSKQNLFEVKKLYATPVVALDVLKDAEHYRHALNAAANSLDTIAMLAGKKEYGEPPIATYLETFLDVRGYAKNRAMVAFAAMGGAND